MKSSYYTLIVLGVILLGLFWWQGKSDNLVESKADWPTYRNEKYGFELKYPPDWYFVPSEGQAGFRSMNPIGGLIPLDLENRYCDIKDQLSFLIQNYQRYNPPAADPEKLAVYEKILNCSIQIWADDNNTGLSIVDYLRKHYVPFARNEEEMVRKIDDLVIEKTDDVEIVKTDFSFSKFGTGFDGSELESFIDSAGGQLIINTKGYIVFITDNIRPSFRIQPFAQDLFEKISNSLEIL